jgi:hypothetical protein
MNGGLSESSSWDGPEPSLAALLHDPVLQAIMVADRVNASELADLIDDLAHRLARAG